MPNFHTGFERPKPRPTCPVCGGTFNRWGECPCAEEDDPEFNDWHSYEYGTGTGGMDHGYWEAGDY